jgi:succinyl-diaminopimelate desuccinylase
VAEVTNKKPSVTMCMGSLDMRYFVNAGVPTISYGPGNMQMAHVENECVSIEDLMTSAKVYALATLKLLSMQEG